MPTPAARPGTALIRWADAEADIVADQRRRMPQREETMMHLMSLRR